MCAAREGAERQNVALLFVERAARDVSVQWPRFGLRCAELSARLLWALEAPRAWEARGWRDRPAVVEGLRVLSRCACAVAESSARGVALGDVASLRAVVEGAGVRGEAAVGGTLRAFLAWAESGRGAVSTHAVDGLDDSWSAHAGAEEATETVVVLQGTLLLEHGPEYSSRLGGDGSGRPVARPSPVDHVEGGAEGLRIAVFGEALEAVLPGDNLGGDPGGALASGLWPEESPELELRLAAGEGVGESARREEDALLETLERAIVDADVRAVACQKRIHPSLKARLARRGLVVLERLGVRTTEPLCQLAGATLLRDWRAFSLDDAPGRAASCGRVQSIHFAAPGAPAPWGERGRTMVVACDQRIRDAAARVPLCVLVPDADAALRVRRGIQALAPLLADGRVVPHAFEALVACTLRGVRASAARAHPHLAVVLDTLLDALFTYEHDANLPADDAARWEAAGASLDLLAPATWATHLSATAASSPSVRTGFAPLRATLCQWTTAIDTVGIVLASEPLLVG